MNFRRVFIFILITLNVFLFIGVDDMIINMRQETKNSRIFLDLRDNLEDYLEIKDFLLNNQNYLAGLIEENQGVGYILDCDANELFKDLIMEELPFDFNPLDLLFVGLEHITLKKDGFLALQTHSAKITSLNPSKSPDHYIVFVPKGQTQILDFFQKQNQKVSELKSLKQDNCYYVEALDIN